MAAKSVRVKFSPYTYARVAVMKSDLLKKEDYDRLAKMQYNEILANLGQRSYKQELDRFEVQQKGLGVVDYALNAHLTRIVAKLKRISTKGLKQVLSAFSYRYDIANAKTLLRHSNAQLVGHNVQDLLYETMQTPTSFWEQVSEQKTVEQAYEMIAKKFKLANAATLFEMENELDSHYFIFMQEFAQTLKGKDGELLTGFIRQEKELANIKTLLRLVSHKQDATPFLHTPSRFLKELLKLDSVEKITKRLHAKKYTILSGDESDLLVKLEVDLAANLLRKKIRLMHSNLLSSNYIIGFMFAKEAEVANCKALLKGTKLGIEMQTLQEMLVIAS